ncbi:MAG: MaoC/PaaZ C-terminal domain-containing protein [Gemmatimonadota bacterium]
MESKDGRKKYWEDLREGEPLSCDPVIFERSDIVFFGKKFDPLPFHTDEAAAGASLFGGLVASALHTLAACTRVVVEAQGDVAIMSGIGLDAVRLFNPVRPGDVLTVKARWSGLRRSRTKPDRGLAGIRCTVSNQRGEPVAEYGYRYLVACRDVA